MATLNNIAMCTASPACCSAASGSLPPGQTVPPCAAAPPWCHPWPPRQRPYRAAAPRPARRPKRMQGAAACCRHLHHGCGTAAAAACAAESGTAPRLSAGAHGGNEVGNPNGRHPAGVALQQQRRTQQRPALRHVLLHSGFQTQHRESFCTGECALHTQDMLLQGHMEGTLMVGSQ